VPGNSLGALLAVIVSVPNSNFPPALVTPSGDTAIFAVFHYPIAVKFRISIWLILLVSDMMRSCGRGTFVNLVYCHVRDRINFLGGKMFRFFTIFSFLLLIQPMAILDAYAQDDFEYEAWGTIDELRASGDFSGALVVARELVAVYESDSEALDYKLGDAAREVTTLEFILKLDPDAQAAMAEAATLEFEVYDACYSEEYGIAAAPARRFLAFNRQYLGPRHHETADAAQLYAYVLDNLDKLPAADDLFSNANEIYYEIFEPIHPGIEALLNNWASVLEKLWRYEEALALRRRALAMATELYRDDPNEIGLSLNNLGACLQETGRFSESLGYLTEALKVREEYGAPDDILQSRINLASLYKEQGSIEKCSDQLVQARAFIENNPDLSLGLVAATLKLWAVLLFEKQDYKEAERVHRIVLELRKSYLPERSISVANARLDLGAALLHQGRFSEASEEIEAGISTLEEIFSGGNPSLVWAYGIRAGQYWYAEKYERATEEYARTAEMYEEVRFRLGAWGTLDIFETPWFEYAACLLVLGREEEAWRALEAGQGRILADVIKLRDQNDFDTDETKKLRLLTEDVESASHVLAGAPADLSESDTPSGSFDSAIRDLKAAESALGNYCADLSRGITQQPGRAISLAQVQSSLSADEAIMGWLLIDPGEPTGRAWGYVIRNSGSVHWVHDLPVVSKLDEISNAAQCASAFRNQKDWQHLASLVWEDRLAPLLPYLEDVTRLVVIPSGDMLGIPVEAMGPLGEPGLGTRFRTSYTPSAEVFVQLRNRAGTEMSTGQPRVLALGDPPFNSQQLATMKQEESAAPSVHISMLDQDKSDLGPLPLEVLRSATDGDRRSLESLHRLPRSRNEALAVFELGGEGSLVLLGPDCSEQRLIGLAHSDSLFGFDLVHIATHAIVRSDAPRRSSLVLSQVDLPDSSVDQTGNPDGLVTAQEIADSWRLGADLVALTGCETGLGRHQLGEGFLGFTNVFLQQGANSVLVSLWPVEDRSSSLFVKRFYELYLGTDSTSGDKAASLAEAKVWLQEYEDELSGLKPYMHPQYWAGFVLVGNPD